MRSNPLYVTTKVGLHAEPAMFFLKIANEFESEIWIEKNEHKVNVKSLLGILSLNIQNKDHIIVVAEGSDEGHAVEAISELLQTGFDDCEEYYRKWKPFFSTKS